MDNIDKILRQAVAKGLNKAAELALQDIKGHVQIRTGALQQSWTIAQKATPDRWQARLDSPIKYKTVHYPYRIPRNVPPERNRSLLPPPKLFKDGKGIDFEKQAKELIEREINEAFNVKK